MSPQRFTDQPIQKKLFRLLLLATGAVMLVLFATMLLNNSLRMRDAILAQVQVLAESTAINVTPSLIFNDPVSAHEILTTLRVKPEIVHAELFNANGVLFAEYRVAGHRAGTDGIHLITWPIAVEREAIGQVRIQVDLSGSERISQRDVLAFAAAALFALLLVWLIARRLGRGISRPLEELASTTQAIAHDKDFSRSVGGSGPDEVGKLVDAFNHMLQQLQARERELQEHRDHLEAMVQQRTQELVAAKEHAEKANRAKSEFLSRMSHELRTPMNAILGFAQIMEMDTALSAENQTYLAEVRRAGDHLLQLINEVLDLARIEAGRMQVSLEPVECGSVLSACLHLTQPLADKRGIRISHDDCDGHFAYADRLRLKQVLINLLTNAVKYNRDGGSVHIHLAPDAPAGRVRIGITDTGSGIPADKQEAIFQPFTRLELDRQFNEGTGIGLTISRHLVELMGGRIEVESTPGKGSTFWIDLPQAAADTHHPLPESPRDALPEVVAGMRKVVYIEDNPSNLRLMEHLLGHYPNITLLSAPDDEVGMPLIERENPDLILLDINLPGLNGYEIASILRGQPATHQTPLIAISANAMPHDIERGLAAGFDAYLTKPLDIKEFFVTLNRYLG